MKDCYLIKNGQASVGNFIKSQNKLTQSIANSFKQKLANEGLDVTQSLYLVPNKRPQARDGHSGLTVEVNGKPHLFIFGGDRYKMPYNDTHIFDLSAM
jgi:hypothetical protein